MSVARAPSVTSDMTYSKRTLLTVLAAAGLALATATTATAVPVGAAVRSVTTPGGHTFRLRMVAAGLGLPAGGGTVHVSGSGYNADQGIVIALCAIPVGVTVGSPSTYTEAPSPCLGGSGSTTESDDGAFAAGLVAKPRIASGVVCGDTVRCAIVTKADSTAPGNRLYDQYIKVNFG